MTNDESNTTDPTDYETNQYYYHPDHLGSSSFVTDEVGKVYEHLEYFPFGETWIHQHSNTQRTPYRFTGKEYDEVTGLYYYGARYYDPRTSVWQSPDPILDEYMPTGDKKKDKNLPGMGGIFNPRNLSMFSYTFNNPVRYIDPTGNDTRPVPGPITSSYIKDRIHPVTGKVKDHLAIDMSNPVGSPVVAFRSGKVIKVRQGKSGKANSITIMYNKVGGETQTYGTYSHTASSLKKGDRIDEGNEVGVTDLSGKSTGGHLHYAKIDVNGEKVNPTSDIAGSSDVGAAERSYETQNESS